ncbi:MAG: hypothetical protein PHH02_05395 [Dehalococcoidales bacterium]|jgi:hypothetical protein|nr:hypothetical protein [Dehalococcoidales bacterium]
MKTSKGRLMAEKYDGKFVINSKGKAVSVLLDIKTYQKMLSGLEELESIHAYDAAKSSGDAAIPFEHAVQEIEKSHQCSTTS